MNTKTGKIYVAGHSGMVGSAITRSLIRKGYKNILTASHSELDLIDQKAVHSFLLREKPDYIFIAAAKMGSMYAIASQPADFIYENLLIEANLIHGAHAANVNKILFIASSTIYPFESPQPMKEEYLMKGPLHSSVEPYALAKIIGIKLCEYYNRQFGRKYISVVCPNLYGINDNYDPLVSNVLPSLIRRIYKAKKSGDKSISIWGSGRSRREFLYVEDLADACIFLMETHFFCDLLNVGTGHDIAIYELVDIIKKIMRYDGEVIFDISKPDGAPRKLIDISRLEALGWRAQTNLLTGIKLVVDDGSFINDLS